MLKRILRHIFRRQLYACFIGVDSLMLGAVITEQAFDIWHEADRPNISDQQNQADDALQQIAQPGSPTQIVFCHPTETGRQEEEKTHAYEKGKAHREIERRTFQ